MATSLHASVKKGSACCIYSYTRCGLYSVHTGMKDDCSLDKDSGGSDYQLSDGTIEDTDRSDNLFRGEDRKDILQACDNQCFYCFTPLSGSTMEADHLEAVTSGGPHNLDNAVAACRSCNRKKGSKSHRKFIEKSNKQTNKIKKAVRCHGYTHQGKRCKNPESPGTRNYFCHCHGGV